MNRDEYYAAVEAYKQNRVEHGEWKKHKYIRIENGRYIYPEDVKGGASSNAPAKSAPNNYNTLVNSPAVKKAAADSMNKGREAVRLVKEAKETASKQAEAWFNRERAINAGTSTRKQDKELKKLSNENENKKEELKEKTGLNASDYTKKELDEIKARNEERNASIEANKAKREAHEAESKAKKEAEFKNDLQRMTDTYSRSLAGTRGNPEAEKRLLKEIGDAQKQIQKKYEDAGYSKEEAESKATEWMVNVGIATASWDDYNDYARNVSKQEEAAARNEGRKKTEQYKTQTAVTKAVDTANEVKKKISKWFGHSEMTKDEYYAAIAEYKARRSDGQRVPF